MPVVVGGVVEVAPPPCPEAPVVPALPVAFEPAVPLWPLPVDPIELPPVVPLVAEPAAVEPIAGLAPVSLPLVPVVLHAAKDSVIMLLMRRPRTVFMIISW